MTDEGRENLVARLKVLHKTRPKDVCFALIGYSTGVISIEKALSGGAEAVPPEVGSQIASVEMFADPKEWPGVKDRQVGADYRKRTKYWCNPTDPLCSPSRLGTHTHEEWEKCQETKDPGVCLTPTHLPPAYRKSAKDAASWAASKVTDSTPVPTRAHLTSAMVGADGNTLWDLARRYNSSGQAIYEANRSLLEKTAQNHGLASSDGGHWIFPGTSLIIPPTG